MYSCEVPPPGSTAISFSSPQYGHMTVAVVSAVPSPTGKSSIGSSPLPCMGRDVIGSPDGRRRELEVMSSSSPWRGICRVIVKLPAMRGCVEHVSFTDSNGVSWVVREDGADEARSFSSDVAPGSAWLRFESDLEVRRLWHYPDDWRGLNPIQRETLLDRASTVVARFRSTPRASAAADDGHRPDAMPSGFRSATTMPEPGPGARSRPERDDR